MQCRVGGVVSRRDCNSHGWSLSLSLSSAWSSNHEGWRLFLDLKRDYHDHLLKPLKINQSVTFFSHFRHYQRGSCRQWPRCAPQSPLTLYPRRWSYTVQFHYIHNGCHHRNALNSVSVNNSSEGNFSPINANTECTFTLEHCCTLSLCYLGGEMIITEIQIKI